MLTELNNKNIPIILASASPRRREILETLNIPFEIILPEVDEKAFDTDDMNPSEKVLFLSRQKAEAVAKKHPNTLVIGSDTVVAVENQKNTTTTLEKPEGDTDTRRMLNLLSGTTHSVLSGITVCYQGNTLSDYYETKVTFEPLTKEKIDWYIATGEPEGKAGGYAIQGYGSLLVKGIEGCYFNVVGMSPYLLNQLTQKILIL